MKHDEIINLSREDFIGELRREGSRVGHNPLQWTMAWAKANNYKVKVDAQNWVATGTDDAHTPDKCHQADIDYCIGLLTKGKNNENIL